MHCPDVTLRSIRSHLSHVASLSIYNVFKILFYVRFYHCMYVHFSVSTVTCTFVTCFIKYQLINQLLSIKSAEQLFHSLIVLGKKESLYSAVDGDI